MSDWDDENFEPDDPTKTGPPAKTDKWDGEDEDDDVKDNWDADSDEEKKDESKEGDTDAKAVQKKKKKKLAEKIAEKEEAKLRELEEARLRAQEEADNSTPEAKMAEKLRLQRLEEDQQLELTKELLGVKDEDNTGLNFKPQTEEDFKQLRTDLLEKLRDLESSDLYQDFAADLINGLCMNLNVTTLKKVKSEVEAYTSNKLKEEKALKSKKAKPGKATIKMETDRSMFGRGLDDGYNDMDDFM